jgi:hypothetical protein
LLRRFERGTATTFVAERGSGIEALFQLVKLPVAALGSACADESEIRAVVELAERFELDRSNAPVLVCLGFVGVDIQSGQWGPPAKALMRRFFSELVTDPRPVATFIVVPTASFSLALPRFPGSATSVVGGHSLFHRDLRGVSARQLIDAVMHSGDEVASSLPGVRPEVLISPETVREALLVLDEPERLARSPLVALRLVDVEAGAGAKAAEKAVALARVLRDVVVTLDGGARGRAQRAVLEAVFVTRSGKHEKLASDLGMPYGTFRRQVARGIARVSELLRLREQGAGRAATAQP